MYMARFFVIMFTCITSAFAVLSSGTVSRHTIADSDFVFLHEYYDLYDSKGSVLRCYYETPDRNLMHRFTFTLDDRSGSCGARSIEEGAYEIDGNIVTLYTLWHREGHSYDTPYGARITRYIVQKDGTFKLLSSRIYIEETAKGFDPDSGERFLWKQPKTDSDKKAFAAYIGRMQKRFKGKFVTDEEAKALIKEVKEALERKARHRWGGY